MTHIAHMNHSQYDGKTLCGEVVRGGRNKKFWIGTVNRREEIAHRERVLNYWDWVCDSDETCVSCEAHLETNGLAPRG